MKSLIFFDSTGRSLQILILFCFGIFTQKSFAFDFVSSGESWLSLRQSKAMKSDLNPGNQILKHPETSIQLELRPDFRIEAAEHKFVMRPAWILTSDLIKTQNPDDEKSKSQGQMQLYDAFWQWSLNEKTQITNGLFVEGWGPAEFANPSNPFFHAQDSAKSLSFREKGQILSKLVLTANDNLNFIFVLEPISNQEAQVRAEKDFQPKWIARTEWISSQHDFNLSFSAGQELDQAFFVGEHLLFSHESSGFSAYIEARQTESASKFDLVQDSFSSHLELQKQKGWTNYSIAGLRYEGDFDLRFEWIEYQLGYSEKEWDQLILALKVPSPYLTQTASRFARPGIEYLTKNLLSASIRVPNIGPKSDWQWMGRVLAATGDRAFSSARSGSLMTSLEIPAYSAWTLLFEIQASFGKTETEFRLQEESSSKLAARYAW